MAAKKKRLVPDKLSSAQPEELKRLWIAFNELDVESRGKFHRYTLQLFYRGWPFRRRPIALRLDSAMDGLMRMDRFVKILMVFMVNATARN